MRGKGSLVQFARPELMARIKASRERVWLVAPFLSGRVADKLIEAAKTSGVEDLRMLTALTERSVRSRVLDPSGLRRMGEEGFEVRSLQGLHAKVSIVDSWGLVGSGNLTNSGLGWDEDVDGNEKLANVELGVILADSQVTEAEKLVEHWWKTARSKTVAEIAEYEKLEPYPSPPGGLDKDGKSIGVFGTARLKEILEEEPDPDRRYWLDPNYHDYREEGWWRERGWVSDRRKADITEGDLIVIYLAARDGGPAKCPAVGRALGTPKKEPDFLREERDDEAVERWPWVTWLEIIGDVPADDGVGLDLIGKTGQSLQGGPIEIERADFEKLARELVS